MNKKLLEYQDVKYQEFSKKLLPGIDNIIGIRLPILRKLAKEIEFNELTDDTFEEVMLQGILIGNIKDIDEVIVKIKEFVPKIDNWSICDSFVSSLKITKTNLDKMYDLIINYKSGTCYEKRFLLVMLLNYYLNDEYIELVIDIILTINYSEYYTMMALAWLISKMYINYKSKVIYLFESNKLNDEVINKSISKIKDSYLVSREDKILIDSYKR